MNFITGIWNFVINPPQEVSTAALTLASDLGTCALSALVKFGSTVISVL